eukprot:TRINITY_DN89294_c0_g1_i1.p1 TRINITY_DN89294_c0_g1~~TRINITY_DN89294_c0_g1_i1.p1  ORF type:complete len:389 (+),score=63.14 TRINITY_DN89294_c0_g1_i1:38-1168(+)
MARATVEDALAVFKRGDLLIVADSTDRKNECDLVFPADHATPERMAFAIRHGSGIVYTVTDKERLDHFGIHPATSVNTDRFAVGAYVSTTFLPGSSTGLSAADRAATARALCNRANAAESFSKPGHMFPVVASPGGVLERPGHTEAASDLCRLSGRTPAACITELTLDDGSMLRWEAALDFGKRHGILVISVDQLIEYRRAHPEFPNAPNPDGVPSIRGLDLPAFDGSGLRIAIVSARWNSVVCRSLEAGAREALDSCGVRDVTVEYVGGSYEIPAAAQALLESGRFDGIICIGCLIKGQSMHFEYINEAVTQGIMRLNLDYKVPVVYGILSVLNEEQAKERSGVGGAGHNSGKEWGITCVESCLLRKRYRKAARL